MKKNHDVDLNLKQISNPKIIKGCYTDATNQILIAKRNDILKENLKRKHLKK